jgi:hypothetical protein
MTQELELAYLVISVLLLLIVTLFLAEPKGRRR